eukprot:811777-Rhodomonas_salina.1
MQVPSLTIPRALARSWTLSLIRALMAGKFFCSVNGDPPSQQSCGLTQLIRLAARRAGTRRRTLSRELLVARVLSRQVRLMRRFSFGIQSA